MGAAKYSMDEYKVNIVIIFIYIGVLMSVGIWQKTAKSEIQIDSDYRNVALEENGSLSFSAGETYDTYKNISYTDYWTKKLIEPPTTIWRPSDDYYSSFWTQIPYTPYPSTKPDLVVYIGARFYAERVVHSNNYGGFQAQTINWKMFREKKSTEGSSGFFVWNKKGHIVFNSNLEYLKIHSIETVTMSSPSAAFGVSGEQTITHSDISNPFYLVTFNHYYKPLAICVWEDGTYGHSIANKTVGLKKVSATSVKIGWYDYGTWYYGTSYPTVDVDVTPDPTIATILICEGR